MSPTVWHGPLHLASVYSQFLGAESQSGVYVLSEATGEKYVPFYVGEASDLLDRLSQHLIEFARYRRTLLHPLGNADSGSIQWVGLSRPQSSHKFLFVPPVTTGVEIDERVADRAEKLLDEGLYVAYALVNDDNRNILEGHLIDALGVRYLLTNGRREMKDIRRDLFANPDSHYVDWLRDTTSALMKALNQDDLASPIEALDLADKNL